MPSFCVLNYSLLNVVFLYKFLFFEFFLCDGREMLLYTLKDFSEKSLQMSVVN